MVKLINLYSNNSKYAYIHPIEKLLLLLISLIFCSYTINIFLIICNIIIFIILNLLANNPKSLVIKYVNVALLFSIFTSISLFWQGRSLEFIILIFLRGINGAFTLAFFTLTTPINHIVLLFSKYEYLRDIGDIIKSMERFLLLLEDDVFVTFSAIKCRGGFSSFKKGIRDFGRAFGVIFKNLIDRWRELNIALNNRCYKGVHNYSNSFMINKKRVTILIAYLFLMIIFSNI